MDSIYYFISVMPKRISRLFLNIDENELKNITELRIRCEKPLVIYIKNMPCFINGSGKTVNFLSESALNVTDAEFDEILDKLCNNSYHTNMNTMINGYVTAINGSRVGVAGEAVYKNGELVSVKNINSLNIRISHEIKGCSRFILSSVYTSSNPSIIIAGPPGSGKTTVIRDMAALLSSGFAGKYRKISVIDERKEISQGFDIGINSDVICAYQKAKGIENCVRTLSPDIVICDEIGNEDEVKSIEFGFSCGASFILTVHLNSPQDLLRNKILQRLLSCGEFSYLVYLGGDAGQNKIIDLTGEKVENCGNYNDNDIFYLYNA